MNETLQQSVTAEIRGELARQDITHAVFARICGWTPTYFSRRISGGLPWTTDEIELIAKKLGMTPEQLLWPRQERAS